MIKVLLTFDYEIFFGKNYTNYEEVLFMPTDILLQKGKELGIPLVFFPDMLSIALPNENIDNEYTEAFISQLNNAISQGNDVQMHFHPHWINAKYDKNTCIWSLVDGIWSFSDLVRQYGEHEGKALLYKAHNCFLNTFKKQPIAFRAGGFSISNDDISLLSYLIELSYRFDSSVVPGQKIISDVQNYDFVHTPDKSNWKIDLSRGFTFHDKYSSEPGIYEVPVSTVPKSFHSKVKSIRDILFSRPKPLYRKGRGISSKIQSKVNQSSFISFDYADKNKCDHFISLFDRFVSRHQDDRITTFTIVSHPKNLSAESIECLSLFVNKLRERHKSKVDFVTFCELTQVNANEFL